MKKLTIFLTILCLWGCFFYFCSECCFAQTLQDASKNLTDTAGGAGFSTSVNDPRVLAGQIIRIALGLLGIVFLGIVVYGGFTWMIARGDQKQVDKAKDYITNGVIGLAIILSAYAITYFVVNALVSAGSATEAGKNLTPPNP